MNIPKHATVVDVRTRQEYDQSHFPFALNIPLDEVQQRINEFKEFSKPIVAYCKSGNRSGMAVNILRQLGITEAVNGGGLEDMFSAKIS